MEFLVILAVVAGAVLAVVQPFRGKARETDERLEAERAELDALKEAKYREIRDAELDYRTGKLSETDWKALDRTLRAEAVDILKRLDEVESLPSAAVMVNTVLSVLQVFIAVGVIFLVLLHSGKDAGMSGAFGVGVAGGTSGGSLMEKNLDRWTIIFAVLFVANTMAILLT